ncbi:MAG: hypothetical protein R6U10_01420 [Thermoplasmatota archaeon]
MRDSGKQMFSKRDMTLVTAVAAVIIGIGVISAFPSGLHLSPSYHVRYTGTDTTLLLGDIGIDGDITGSVGLRNISSWHIAAAGQVTVDTTGGTQKTFVDPDIVVRGGDGAVNGTMHIPAVLTPGVVVFNGSHGGAWAFAAESIPLVVSPGAMITVHDAAISVDNGSWTGQGTFYLHLTGDASATARADYGVVSTGDIVELTVEPGADFNRTLLDMLGEELPPLPVSLGGVVAILPENGTTIAVDGDRQRCDNMSLGRGTWNASLGRQVSLRGDARLLLLDGSLYSPADAAIWFIPTRLLGLWPLAVGVWLVTAWLQRRYRPGQEAYDRGFHWLAVIVHVLTIIVTFFLWDAETRYLFGTSMLDAAITTLSTGSLSLSAWAVTPLELVPWFIGLALIALPIRVVLTGAFRLTGYDTIGGGIAKAVGLLSLLVIGAIYIPFFLNVTVLALLRSMLGL